MKCFLVVVFLPIVAVLGYTHNHCFVQNYIFAVREGTVPETKQKHSIKVGGETAHPRMKPEDTVAPQCTENFQFPSFILFLIIPVYYTSLSVQCFSCLTISVGCCT